MRRLLLLSIALLLAPPAQAAEPFPLLGTWYVLVHYRDASSPRPRQWRWEDRVWEFREDGGELVWTEYLLVHFVDASGRFRNLGTPLAQRIDGAWEPNDRQQKQIETGLRVTTRSARRQRLEPRESGWQSSAGAEALTALSEDSIYLSGWSIEIDGGLPSLRQVDALHSRGGREDLGVTRYRLRSRELGTGALRGEYRRDGVREGRVRLTPTHLAESAPPSVDEEGRVRLVPHGAGVPVRGSLFLSVFRPFHYYGDRTIKVETTPVGARLDLSYLRRGTQLLYARAESPAALRLPARIAAEPHDVVRIRAYAPGHRREIAIVPVRSSREHVALDLAPLPNTLVRVNAQLLAGRAQIVLQTVEPPQLRARRTRDDYTVVLLQTGLDGDAARALAELRTPHVAESSARVVGDDAVLTFALTPAARAHGVEIRTLTGHDPARERHWTALDWAVPDERAAWADRVRAALGAAELDPASACVERFDSALVAAVAPATGGDGGGAAAGFLSPVRRAALRRVGALEVDGRLHRGGGRPSLDPRDPLELELALADALGVRGYPSLLAALVERLESPGDRMTARRALLAPSMPPDAFATAWAAASDAAGGCIKARARSDPAP